MDNQTFINQMKYTYESLSYFSIEENNLVLNYEGLHSIPLQYISLATLNQHLYLLNPKEIFNIIYMLELLFKKSLTENEINFINNYTKRYLTMNDLALSNQAIDQILLWGLSIPIYTSYDSNTIITPAKEIIHNTINNHDDQLLNDSSSNTRGPKLTLTKLGAVNYVNDEEPLKYFGQAGYATLLLIISTVATTCLYIFNFILKG